MFEISYLFCYLVSHPLVIIWGLLSYYGHSNHLCYLVHTLLNNMPCLDYDGDDDDDDDIENE